jgi:serine/threonine protein kinase
MGEVYRARDTRLGRTVALKILPTHLRSNPQLLARFEREARTIAGLNHPCICTLHDVGRHEDIDFLVMEFVEGETLSSRLRRGRLSIQEAVRLTREVAEALAAAHAKGIIHRDIKPSNIIVSSGGHVKVVDFGLARGTSLFDGAETTRDGPTEPGVRVGTPRYMSPEQALGQPLDPRTDIFSLGVVIFECLTGELPFEGATRYAYLQSLLSGRVKPLAELRADVPDSLRAVLARCLERDASKRLDSASWLAAELDGIERGRGPMSWRLARWAIGGAVVAAGVWIVATSTPLSPTGSPTSTDDAQLRRFTTLPGEESDSHFSPDGMWVSFMTTEQGRRRLFVQQVDGGEPRPVTLPVGKLQSHVWSPDGTSYACLMFQDPAWTVQIVPNLFGNAVPVQTVQVPQISRAAKLLRWIDRAIYLQVEESGRSLSLQRLNLDGNRFERLTGPWSDMRVGGFDVRPDGGRVVWAATPAGAQWDDLWLADLNGKALKQLTGADDESRKRFPLFSGLGTTVIYQSNRGGQVDLWELDTTGRRLVRRTSDVGLERPESASRNGSLSYQLASQKTTLWIWNARDGKGTQVSDSGLSDVAPTASRDGPLRVAFQRSLPSPVEGFLAMDTDIFVADVTAPQTRLINARKVGTGLAPGLSPDGRLLAYLQRAPEAPGQAQLMVTDVDNGRVEKLSATVLPSVSSFPVDWTEQTFAWASAQDLYFVERAGSPHVSRLGHYRGGRGALALMATVTESRITDISPSFDGKTVAYLARKSTASPEGDAYQLHAFDVGTRTDRVVRDLGAQYLVRLRGWLPDGAGLVLARSIDFNEANAWTLELMVISAEGAVRQKATIDHVVNVSRLVPQYTDLYFTRSVEGIGNLFAYSFASRKVRRASENSVLDVTYGSVAPLGADHVVGIRHEQTRDIQLLDARPRVRRNTGGQ